MQFVMEKIEPKKLVVTQANALMRACCKLTLQEKRIILLLVAMIRRSDDKFKLYEIPVKYIQEYLRINSKDVYGMLDELTNSLIGRYVAIYQENGDWKKFQWISVAEYVSAENSKNGLATLQFMLHEQMRPFLLMLKDNFASIPFMKLTRMPSANSIRIFEILYHESLSLTKSEVYLELDDLKMRLGLKNKYTNFRDFRVRVLNQAKKDCKENSPLNFSFEPIKRIGKKIIGLKFTVWPNKEVMEEDLGIPGTVEVATNALEDPADRLEHEMKLAGYTGDVEQYLREDGLELTRASFEVAVKEMEQAQAVGKDIKNPGGFIQKKLQARVGKAQLLDSEKKRREEMERRRKEQERLEAEKKREEEERERDKMLQERIEEMRKDPEEWERAIQEFETNVLPNLPEQLQRRYRNGGIDEPGIRMFFEAKLAEKLQNTEG